MASQVAPQPPQASANTPTAQPKLPGNGCCLVCCGKSPGPIDAKAILADGGKYVQLQDGRIVEYFLYGSDAKDARVLLQITGSMGTGRIFGQFPLAVQTLKDRNIRGISITVPGHGYSNAQADRKIGDWPKDDVEAVFKAEGITGDFMVEGASFGSAHAFAVAHYFGKRVTKLHLIVPYLPIPIRKEHGWAEFMPDDQLKYTPDYASSCSSCCLFCMCSWMMCCLGMCPSCFADSGDIAAKKTSAVPGITDIVNHDIARSAAQGVHGILYNAFVPTISDNWGFDPLSIKTSKVIVSYAVDDKQCAPEHGEFLAKYFSEMPGVVSKINIGDCGMGHGSFDIQIGNGEFITQIADF